MGVSPEGGCCGWYGRFLWIARHQSGDWGDVSTEDASENDLSVREGFHVLSSYEVVGERLWITTEADYS